MPAKGQTISAEHKAAIAAANKKRVVSAETRAKLSAAGKGRGRSAEFKEKIAQVRKGRRHSPETRAKISASMKGKPFSAEHKANLKVARNSVDTRSSTQRRVARGRMMRRILALDLEDNDSAVATLATIREIIKEEYDGIPHS